MKSCSRKDIIKDRHFRAQTEQQPELFGRYDFELGYVIKVLTYHRTDTNAHSYFDYFWTINILSCVHQIKT